MTNKLLTSDYPAVRSTAKRLFVGTAMAAALAMQPAFAAVTEVALDNFDNDSMTIQITGDDFDNGNATKQVVGNTGVSGIMGGQRIVVGTLIQKGPTNLQRVLSTWDGGSGIWSLSIDDGARAKVDTYWDGAGENSSAYPEGTCLNAGLNADFSTATAFTVYQDSGDLGGTLRMRLRSWNGSADSGGFEAEQATVSGPNVTYTFDPAVFAANGVDLQHVCQVELEIESQVGTASPLDTSIDQITVTMENPEISCSRQVFAGNASSADPGDDILKTVTVAGTDLTTAGCTGIDFSEAISCTGADFDLTVTAPPAGCTVNESAPGVYDFECPNKTLTSANNPMDIAFTTQFQGADGSCSATLTALTCGNLTGTTAGCADSLSRTPPVEIVPAISPMGLTAALIGLPLIGGFVARRRNRKG